MCCSRVFSASDAFAQSTPAPAVETFGATAELLDAGPPVPHCGVVHFIVPMRFRVRALDADQPHLHAAAHVGDTIIVAVSCPMFQPGLYRAGAAIHLRIARTSPWRGGTLMWSAGPHPATPDFWAVGSPSATPR
jgi:hypothetical protein